MKKAQREKKKKTVIIESRRIAAEKALTLIRSNGLPVESDPVFIEWIGQWIAGEIELKDVRERYLQLLHEREAERQARFAARVESGKGTAPDATLDSDVEAG
ncbi:MULTISPECIES: hypothetical protein [unclassified Sinorhizobium]|uniref:hypothetical protein n=1 Tax=unclassified Sinorhizobium TaxID=2613772 RepID=UPI003525B25B